MRFSKWHALGNDYLLVERADVGRPLTPAVVRRLCDAARGIGADGVLEVRLGRRRGADVLIWNPDGSTAELSGNGTRIAARWLSGAGARPIVAPSASASARSSGPAPGRRTVVEQDLGDVAVAGPSCSTSIGRERRGHRRLGREPPCGHPTRIPDREELLASAQLIEHHPRFPERTNVQLVRVDGRHDAHRQGLGAGGGGDAVLGHERLRRRRQPRSRTGGAESPVTVHLPGGDLEVLSTTGGTRS